jgi:dTDP-4-dehydrorhamnose 3,5-epimerase
MKIIATPLPGLVLIELAVFSDDRGCFMTTFQRDRYAAAGVSGEFVQDNFSSSRRGVLRGLHYQLRKPQGKLVHVTTGEVWDVAVDVRRGSPTFGRWYSARLSAENHHQLWIPPGFAHGFLALSERADFTYKVSAPYDSSDERSIRWDDPALAIAWPVEVAPIVSVKDAAAPLLRDAELPEYVS